MKLHPCLLTLIYLLPRATSTPITTATLSSNRTTTIQSIGPYTGHFSRSQIPLFVTLTTTTTARIRLSLPVWDTATFREAYVAVGLCGFIWSPVPDMSTGWPTLFPPHTPPEPEKECAGFTSLPTAIPVTTTTTTTTTTTATATQTRITLGTVLAIMTETRMVTVTESVDEGDSSSTNRGSVQTTSISSASRGTGFITTTLIRSTLTAAPIIDTTVVSGSELSTNLVGVLTGCGDSADSSSGGRWNRTGYHG